MGLTTERCLTEITEHSAALATLAQGRLEVPVPSCPGWSMADLVWHVTGVHWFWRTIAGQQLLEPPAEAGRPVRPADDALLDTFRAGVRALTDTLAAADTDATCWTWALRKDVGFVIRHQVQEAAVHHFDAALAAGADWSMHPDAARDAVEEFLTVSVANPLWPMDDGDPGLGGTLRLGVAGGAYAVTDGHTPGTLAWRPDDGAGDVDPGLALLWLYRHRVDVPGLPDGADPVTVRFRERSFTD